MSEKEQMIKKLAGFLLPVAFAFSAAAGIDPSGLMAAGDYDEAYIGFTNSVFAAEEGGLNAGQRAQSVLDAARCLAKLKRIDEVEPLLEKVRGACREFPVRVACAQALGELPHSGDVVDGVFRRGAVPASYSSCERDRVLRLRWLEEIMDELPSQTNLRKRWFWNEVVSALMMNGRWRTGAWKLQELTDLDRLPELFKKRAAGDIEDFAPAPAPVDECGNPVFYSIVKNWKDAKNDGERFFFANDARAEVDSFGRRRSAGSFAMFSEGQFGTSALCSKTNSLELAEELRTLGDDEGIVMSSGGIKRFRLPIEYNYLRMWRELKDYRSIAREYERRHQFDRAVDAYLKAGCTGDVERITAPAVKSADGDFTPTESGR